MPIYQYKCTSCDELLDIRQSFSDDSLTSAPGCEVTNSDHTLKKVFGAVGIAFKGDGFYKNDTRSSQTTSSASSSSATSSTETKSATESVSKSDSA